MPHGGFRPGAGRPKKNAREKADNGNVGGHDITIVKTDNADRVPATLPTYLEIKAKEGTGLPSINELFEQAWRYINQFNCADLVPRQFVEDFCTLRMSYLECEFMNKKLGRILNGKRSPYVTMALDYLRAANVQWSSIWRVINENSQHRVDDQEDFIQMIANRGW